MGMAFQRIESLRVLKKNVEWRAKLPKLIDELEKMPPDAAVNMVSIAHMLDLSIREFRDVRLKHKAFPLPDIRSSDHASIWWTAHKLADALVAGETGAGRV